MECWCNPRYRPSLLVHGDYWFRCRPTAQSIASDDQCATHVTEPSQTRELGLVETWSTVRINPSDTMCFSSDSLGPPCIQNPPKENKMTMKKHVSKSPQRASTADEIK
ncbi:hypothetical protein J3458_015709 [Metarhizium acridum]|uniref:uncharacterized protein n=1 Tax=Metarhizium acridum TaxID=92637 RepID=UPI001C6B9B83|nr:hypothetical protein J3458_015709 [Metarhizium acridum]